MDHYAIFMRGLTAMSIKACQKCHLNAEMGEDVIKMREMEGNGKCQEVVLKCKN